MTTDRPALPDGLLQWIEAALEALLLRPLSLEQNLDSRFRDMGLESAAAMALIHRLSVHLDRPLSVTLLWEHPTPRALLAALRGERPAVVAVTEGAASSEPVAIIGMACRLPGGADSPEAFWSLLIAGTDAIGPVPMERWDAEAFYDPDRTASGRIVTRRGGFLSDVDKFDPAFFGISPREARQMDPQQRLVLELAWEALEDARVPPDQLLGGAVGVFIGAMWQDYSRIASLRPEQVEQHTATGEDTSIIAARISYALGLEGPSLTVNTACSSSLVALHLAVQSIRSGESTMALVGGVNLALVPHSTLAMSKFGGLSPDGQCKAFDAAANGYVRGEGGGVVVLKRLSAALRDGDPIAAVVRGSAVNNDGFSNGLTAPNPAAQQAVLRKAWQASGLALGEVDYIEAHGTGTRLGDPIEAGALGAVLGRPDEPVAIGSVKTNIGHLEAAAGIAGLIKVALSLREGRLPASLHFNTPSPHIDFARLGLAVQTHAGPWPERDRPWCAGVSSFGFGGTNAHVVLQQAPGTAASLPALPQPVVSLELEPQVVFVCPGHGPLRPGMGWGLLQTSPVFRHHLALVSDILEPITGWSVMALLTDPGGHARLEEIEVVQPVVFAFQVALGQVWADLGVKPAAVLGHSFGEVAAACLAGILTVESGAAVIAHRARLAATTAGQGGMLVVGLPAAQARAAAAPFGDALVVAAINGPETTVLSGEPAAIAAVSAELMASGVFAAPVPIRYASHSPQMTPLQAPLVEALSELSPASGHTPLISTVTGARLDGAEMDGEYWGRNLSDPVRFTDAVAAVASEGPVVFVELSAHPALIRGLKAMGATALPSTRRGQDERTTLHHTRAVLVEQGVSLSVPGADRSAHLLVATGTTKAAAVAAAAQLAETIQDTDRLPDLAHTTLTGRTHHPWRIASAGGDAAQLSQKLRAATPHRAGRIRVGLLCTGQGAQYPGMAADLLEQSPIFRAVIARCDALMDGALLPVLLGHRPGLSQTTWTQPATFAVSMGLHALWVSWGIQPVAVAGHSVGEIAAACIAGVMSLEDGLRMAVLRGQAMGALSEGGAMASLPMSHQAVAAVLSDGVEIAAINADDEVVISGEAAAVEALRLAHGGRALRVSHAFHSHRMEPAVAPFASAIAGIPLNPPRLTLVSALADPDPTTTDHWARHIRQPVRFTDALDGLLKAGVDAVIELGPHPVLSALGARRDAAVSWLPSLRRKKSDWGVLLSSAGRLFTLGAVLDWNAFEAPYPRMRAPLPSYPWQRARYWALEAQDHPRLGHQDQPEVGITRHRVPLSRYNTPLLQAHTIAGQPTAPAALYLMLMLAAQESARPALSGVIFPAGLALSAPEQTHLHVRMEGDAVVVGSGSEAQLWQQHALAERGIASSDGADQMLGAQPAVADALYEALGTRGGVVLGEGFRWLSDIRLSEAHLSAALRTDLALPGGAEIAALDGALQALALIILSGEPGAATRVPFRVGRLTCRAPLQTAVQVTAQVSERQARSWQGEVTLWDAAGGVVARLQEVVFAARVPERAGSVRLEAVRWVPQPMTGATPPSRWLLLSEDPDAAQELAEALPGPCRILPTLHGAVDAGEGVVDLRPLEQTEPRGDWGCASALQTVQALLDEPRRLWLVTAAGPVGAAVRGLARTVRREHPELQCRTIAYDDTAALAAELIGGGVDEVVLVGGERRVLHLEPLPPAESAPIRGTWLVTGGFGALGRSVAGWLAGQGAEGLVLVGRSVDAERAEFAASLSVPTRAVAADMADEDAVQALIGATEGLRGIVHAAGVLDDGVIAALSAERLERVLAPKAQGAWSLHRACASIPLDAFVMFGSVVGVLGAAGQGNYAAANAVLESLAAARVAAGLPAVCIAWGPWQTGMAESLSERARSRWQREGFALLQTTVGLGLLGEALSAADPVILAAARARPARVAPQDHSADADTIAQTVGSILGIAAGEVPEETPLRELGLDSLMAIDLRNALSTALDRTLPATLAFDHPTLTALRAFLTEAEPVAEVRVAQRHDEPIAIVGMACRYPGADTPEALWALLEQGTDATSEIPPQRWDVDALYDPDGEAPGRMVTRRGGFLANVDQFDPAFFGISGREAERMDPQQRLLLEVSWEALERAGIPVEALSGAPAGVFVGIMSHEYDRLSGALFEMDGYGITGNLGSVASGRISYTFGLTGPSMTIDTACSSSLVTLHLAAQSLRAGECDLAIAGGATLVLTPDLYVEFSR
ncbi:MAG: acyl transferase domain-containing protein/acyl carrier protein, partial [Myxococcota bacterium]